MDKVLEIHYLYYIHNASVANLRSVGDRKIEVDNLDGKWDGIIQGVQKFVRKVITPLILD